MQDLRSLAERYTAAWCSQDPASVAEFFAPRGTLTINEGEPAVGRGAIARVAADFMAAFPDMVVRMEGLESVDGRTIYHWTLVGRNTGPGGTGHRVHVRGHESWRIGEDGLIAESLGRFDAEEYARQLEHGVKE